LSHNNSQKGCVMSSPHVCASCTNAYFPFRPLSLHATSSSVTTRLGSSPTRVGRCLSSAARTRRLRHRCSPASWASTRARARRSRRTRSHLRRLLRGTASLRTSPQSTPSGLELERGLGAGLRTRSPVVRSLLGLRGALALLALLCWLLSSAECIN
jgi:hypothetical protein